MKKTQARKTQVKHILIAEDEDHIAKLIAFKLQKEGFAIQIARNGREAIDSLGLQTWSLLILDLMMPICDGWEVLSTIQASAQEEWIQIPILVLTAKNDEKPITLAAEGIRIELLKKPFDPRVLSQVVRKMVGT